MNIFNAYHEAPWPIVNGRDATNKMAMDIVLLYFAIFGIKEGRAKVTCVTDHQQGRMWLRVGHLQELKYYEQGE